MAALWAAKSILRQKNKFDINTSCWWFEEKGVVAVLCHTAHDGLQTFSRSKRVVQLK